jgi:hypothetical protein
MKLITIITLLHFLILCMTHYLEFECDTKLKESCNLNDPTIDESISCFEVCSIA